MSALPTIELKRPIKVSGEKAREITTVTMTRRPNFADLRAIEDKPPFQQHRVLFQRLTDLPAPAVGKLSARDTKALSDAIDPLFEPSVDGQAKDGRYALAYPVTFVRRGKEDVTVHEVVFKREACLDDLIDLEPLTARNKQHMAIRRLTDLPHEAVDLLDLVDLGVIWGVVDPFAAGESGDSSDDGDDSQSD